MARTIRTKVYKFNELSETAKKKAVEKFYDINVDFEWWDCIDDDAKEIGKLMGIAIEKIYFTGFASQGDGACFEGEYRYEKQCVTKLKEYAPNDEKLHDIVERLFKLQKDNNYSLSATVKHSGHYYHKYCTDITVFKNGDYLYDGGEETEEELKDILRDFMQWIYDTLEEEYFHRTTEEAIIETIEANEYEFTQDGRQFF